MKETVEYLKAKNLVFKSLKPISPKEFGSRKKVELFLGVDTKGYYAVVLLLAKKSRVLQKEAKELMGFHEKLQNLIDSTITKKYVRIQAPLCSKAKALFESEGWEVWGEG